MEHPLVSMCRFLGYGTYTPRMNALTEQGAILMLVLLFFYSEMNSENNDLAYNPCFYRRYEGCRTEEDLTLADNRLSMNSNFFSHMEEMSSVLESRFTWTDCRVHYFHLWWLWDVQYSLDKLSIFAAPSGLSKDSYVPNNVDLSGCGSSFSKFLAVPSFTMRSCHLTSYPIESRSTALTGGDWFQLHEFPPRKRVCVDDSDSHDGHETTVPTTAEPIELSVRLRGPEQK